MIDLANTLRALLEPAFCGETSFSGDAYRGGSDGHCAAVALLVWAMFGGDMQSTTHEGVSHWFNRVKYLGEWYDMDLTGDQFGLPPVQITPAGDMYSNPRTRPTPTRTRFGEAFYLQPERGSPRSPTCWLCRAQTTVPPGDPHTQGKTCLRWGKHNRPRGVFGH